MIAMHKNANAQQELGNGTKQKHNTSNHSKFKSCNQSLRGLHGYEFMKRSFIEDNHNCTSTEYDQACYRFARLAGV
jgi:hypothetical protein